MSHTQFAVYIGLYTDELVDSQDYHKLQVNFAPMFILAHYCRWISRDSNYELMRSEASMLESPTLHYIHKLLVHTISRRRDSMGVVSTRDLFYLCSIRERIPIHLGHTLS